MQLLIPLQVTRHITWCLELTLNCLLISSFPMSRKTNQATVMSGFTYIRTVCAMLTSRPRTNSKPKLASVSSSCTIIDQWRPSSSQLVREFSLVAIPKEELRYRTRGTLRFTKWSVVVTMSTILSLPMVKEPAELSTEQSCKYVQSLNLC